MPRPFGPNEDWTRGPFFPLSSGAGRGQFFANVSNPWRHDAIVINDDTVTVRRSTGNPPAMSILPSWFPFQSWGGGFLSNEDWTGGPFFGSRGTFFADVYGDYVSAIIAVNDDTVTVRQSDTARFKPNTYNLTSGPFYGSRGTFFADIVGNMRSAIIALMDDRVLVRKFSYQHWSEFDPVDPPWALAPFFAGTGPGRGTFFADVEGSGRAAMIEVGDDLVRVRRSNGLSFDSPLPWTNEPFYGSRGTFFADVEGTGRAAIIAVNNDTVTVRQSNGSSFIPANLQEDWTDGPFFGSRGTFFADVEGNHKASAIAVNDGTVTVRRSL